MDTETMIRLIAGLGFAIVLLILVQRRRKRV
jgi:LPXTG-motif cell wall-anchored protein